MHIRDESVPSPHKVLERGEAARFLMDGIQSLSFDLKEAVIMRDIEGMDQAKKTPHIEGIEITLPLNNTVTPLPEGDGYLGFIFSRGDSPESVEKALRQAHRSLTFRIDPLLPVLEGVNSPQ